MVRSGGRLGIGVGHDEREEDGPVAGRERGLEARPGARQAKGEGQPPREPLRRPLVLLEGPEARDVRERVPGDERHRGPPRARDELAAEARRDAAEGAGQPLLRRARPLAQEPGTSWAPSSASE